jgi:hypothetical protein
VSRFGIALDRPSAMRPAGNPRAACLRSPAAAIGANFIRRHWTIDQLVTHHASNGCNPRPGDLAAAETVSGAAEKPKACLPEEPSLDRPRDGERDGR